MIFSTGLNTSFWFIREETSAGKTFAFFAFSMHIRESFILAKFHEKRKFEQPISQNVLGMTLANAHSHKLVLQTRKLLRILADSRTQVNSRKFAFIVSSILILRTLLKPLHTNIFYKRNTTLFISVIMKLPFVL